MATPVLYSVYMHKNQVNNKVYIGVTKQNPEKRFQKGIGYKYSNKAFWEDIEKYGWDKFSHIILETGLSKETVSDREEYYIRLYNSTDSQFGYNVIGGGFKVKRPDVSEMMKKRTGKSNPNFGKPAPKKTREALVNHAKNGQFGINNPMAVAVLQLSKSGDFIARYDSIADAEKVLNISRKSSHICHCCKGQRKSSNGFIWKYERGNDLSQLQY